MAFSLQNSGSSGRRRRALYQPIADINVTPLVDVMLVLLIVFMVTAPMLAQGLKVNLPKATAARPLDPREPVILTLTRDGTIQIGDVIVDAEAMIPALRARLGDDPGLTIHVRADREVAYGKLVEVIDRLARDGLTRLALVATAQKPSPAIEALPGARP